MALITKEHIEAIDTCLEVAEPSEEAPDDFAVWSKAKEALNILERESKKSHTGEVILVTPTT